MLTIEQITLPPFLPVIMVCGIREWCLQVVPCCVGCTLQRLCLHLSIYTTTALSTATSNLTSTCAAANLLTLSSDLRTSANLKILKLYSHWSKLYFYSLNVMYFIVLESTCIVKPVWSPRTSFIVSMFLELYFAQCRHVLLKLSETDDIIHECYCSVYFAFEFECVIWCGLCWKCH